LRVVEILCDQREGEAELRGFGSAHVDHALVVDEVGEVVVEDVVGHLEAAPLHVGVEGAGEDVLEAVVFRAVVVAIDCTVLGVDAAWAHHLLFDEGVRRHVDPDLMRKDGGGYVVHLFFPVGSELEQATIEGLGCGVFTARRVGRVTVTVLYLHDFSVLDVSGTMPGLHDETVFGEDVSEDDDLSVCS
jgi:hypothetical protein